MSEEELCKHVRLLMMSMGLLPSKTGFDPLARSILLQTYYCLPMVKIYEIIEKEFGRNRSCLERGMRTCLTDLDLTEFEHLAQKMSGGYIIKIDTVKLTCHNFIALTSGIIRIACDIGEHPCPPQDRQPKRLLTERSETKARPIAFITNAELS